MSKKKQGRISPLDEEVDLHGLLDRLDFSVEGVVDASREQPMLFMQAASYRAQTMRDRIAAESALSLVRSEKGSKFRASRKEIGDKVTEGQVTERLSLDKAVIQASERLSEALVGEEFAKLLLEGYRMRRDALKIAADVASTEVYISKMSLGEATEMSKIKRRLQDKYPRHKE